MIERYLYKILIVLSVVGLALALHADKHPVMYYGDIMLFAVTLIIALKWHGEA